MSKIRVRIWNEYIHEKNDEKVREIYPEGIHGKISEMLSKFGKDKFEITTATLDDPECGLSENELNNTDVLLWWGHLGHDKVPDEIAARVVQRVREGMGLIVLHSGHYSKPFKMLMGTGCRLKWRVSGDTERIWVIEGSHPIAKGLDEYIEIPQEEMYGEKFDIPAPDELVFISWFSGGEVCRSGCCYKRGLGKIFYFRPGHEEYPIYHREDITKVLCNAIEWANSSEAVKPTFGEYKPEYFTNNNPTNGGNK